MLKCLECNRSFNKKEHRNLHYYRTHVDKKDWPFICKELINDVECGRKCPTELVLNRHIKEVHPVKVISCPYENCQSSFKSENALNTHKKKYHVNGNLVNKLYICQTDGCNASFGKKHQLKAHTFVHTGIEPFQCLHEDCGRKFKTKAQYNRHVQRHGKERQQHKCNECEEIFLYRHLLTKHKKQAHKKNFICKECNKIFKSKENLKNHMKTHLETREKYKCDHCEKSYTKKSNLTKHVKVKHNNAKEYTCLVCSKSYAHNHSLNNHMKEHKPGYVKPPKTPRKKTGPYKKKTKVVNKDSILYMLSGLKTTDMLINSQV